MSFASDIPAEAAEPSPPPAQSLKVGEDERLREILKRCPAATYRAACQFSQTGDARHLPIIVFGIIERFVEPDLRSKLKNPPDDLRLIEDLGIDSLTMMEIVVLVEDVFALAVNNEELRRLHTLGDVRQFIESKLSSCH